MSYNPDVVKYMDIMNFDAKTQVLCHLKSLSANIEHSEDNDKIINSLVGFYIFIDEYLESIGISEEDLSNRVKIRLDSIKNFNWRMSEAMRYENARREELTSETGLFTLDKKGSITRRLFNLLQRNGILSLQAAQNKTAKELMNIRGFGPEALKELMTAMENYGLSFKEEK